jgi:Rrf2 family protein
MKIITRDTDYAVRALCYIACRKDDVISVSDLVEKLGIPKPFLRKLLQMLQKEGLLESYKGKGGGFVLKATARDISLFDLIEIFQGPVQINEHIFKKEKCSHLNTCKIKKRIDVAQEHLIEELKSINIAQLIKDKGERIQ